MDTSNTRRELATSFRLVVGEEPWLFAGLLAGGAGYLIWLAGTGVAIDQFGRVAADTLSADPRSIEIAALVALWILLPSLVAVRYVVGHLTNIRGNIEQCYRFEQPIVLLVPPLVLIVLTLVAGFLQGAVGSTTLVALGIANVFLLVRTVAYGYRVYSLSIPRLLQVMLFVAAVAVSLGVVWRTASMSGQEALVESLAAQYGLAGRVNGGSVSAPLLPLYGATIPGILALGYVWVQIFASLVLRIRRPDVPRSAVRAGQRYPQVIQPGNSRRLVMGTAPSKESGESDANGDGTAGAQSADAVDGTPGPDGPEATDRFGQTRVFTPPSDGDDASGTTSESATPSVKNELCPICGATYAADAGHTQCPNCNAVLDRD